MQPEHRPEPEQQAPEHLPPWHALSADEALQRVDAPAEGLSIGEAERRLASHGPNELRQKRQRPWWRRLAAQFNNVLIIVLIVAAAISAALGQWVDAAVIMGVVLINAAIGFVQEGKAEKALEGIRGMLSPEASVRRDGRRTTVAARDLVPGDIVILTGGDRIPADLRLLQARAFRTQEGPLTGESEPVDKGTESVDRDTDLAERRSMAYAGTLAVQGGAEGVVVATSRETEIGRISEMLEEVEQVQTPLLRQLDHFARVLAAAILAGAAAMGLFGVLVHGRGVQEMFLAGVGLAVAAIPQGLPAIVTITLAIGVRAMARRNAIIRQLPAVETLGAISAIFSDKTGTLTRNEMTVQVVRLPDGEVRISGVGFAPEGELRRNGEAGRDRGDDGEQPDPREDAPLRRLIAAGALCNDSALGRQDDGQWTIEGDPTEGALVVAAAKAGIDADGLRQRHRRIDAVPFDPERKYMATLDEDPEGGRTIHVKGAPDVLLDLCERVQSGDGETGLDRDGWNEAVSDLSARGLRVLALAEKAAGGTEELTEEEVESGLTWLGIVGLLDPPRDAAIDAVGRCRDAGIAAKMVTGDHALTARAIGARLGLAHTRESLSGRDIESLSDEELRDRVEGVDVFARAAPEHKLRLVEAAQGNRRICAMTGDGVNDAPALKRADVGVAMGLQGTEAAKEAAEVVLADDNFASIVNAVEEGRKVYDNIRKAITFLLPTNGAESLAVLIAVLAGGVLPISPVQILWVNMVTAVTLGLALAFEPAQEDLMQRPPRDPGAPILDRFLAWRVLFVSVLLVAPVYGLFLWLQASAAPLETARSAAVNMLVAGEVVYLLNSRYLTMRSLSVRGLLGSRPVLVAIGLVILFQAAWTYTGPMQFLFGSMPLAPRYWGVIAGAAVLLFLLVELEKAAWRRYSRQRP